MSSLSSVKSFKLSDQMRQKEIIRRKKQDEIKAMTDKVALMIKEVEDKKKQELLLLDMKKQEELERLEFELIEKKRLEDEFKTKKYFEFNKYDRKISMDGNPCYYGDVLMKSIAWLPHGKGKFTIYDKEIMQGEFIKGDIVSGTIHFSDNTIWNGPTHNHRMNGVGLYTNAEGITNEVIARDNYIICYKHQLTNGLQIQFLNQMHEIAPILNRKPIATVIKHICNWKYLIKFHDEVWPENREIDLEIYSKFQVLEHKPYIYSLEGFDTITMKAKDRVYDYQYEPVLAHRLLRDNAMERLEDQDSIDQLQETYSLKQSSDGDRGTKDDNINNQDRILSIDDDFTSTIATNTIGSTIDSPTMVTMKSSIHFKDTADKELRGKKKVTISLEDTSDHNRMIELSPNSKQHNKLPKISKDTKEQNHAQIKQTHQQSQLYSHKAIDNNNNNVIVNNDGDHLNEADDTASVVTDISLSTYGGLHHPYNNHSNLHKNKPYDKDIQSLPDLLRYASAMKKEQYRIEQMNKLNTRKYLLSNTQRLIPKFPKREYQDRMKSFFEAKVIGIGRAQEDDENEKLLELKKRQWRSLIEEKREKQAEDRKKEIEQQQQEFLNSSLAEKHLEDQAKKDEYEQYLKDTQAAVDEELSLLSKGSYLSKAEETMRLKRNPTLQAINLSKLEEQEIRVREDEEQTTVSKLSTLSKAEDFLLIKQNPSLNENNLRKLTSIRPRPWRYRDEEELSIASQVSQLSQAEEIMLVSKKYPSYYDLHNNDIKNNVIKDIEDKDIHKNIVISIKDTNNSGKGTNTNPLVVDKRFNSMNPSDKITAQINQLTILD